ncbi:MAG: hypothetical protein K2N80_11575 [Lachnospiraceae bacterium]|nr:hypothetical protein [Lachnospiraceae bacterium]
MFFVTTETISNLNEIISGLNAIEDADEKEKFLNEHIEDTTLFVETLKKINKNKLPKEHGKSQKKKNENVDIKSFTEEEIYEIFHQKSNKEVMSEYSLSDLKKMYLSVYKRRPSSNYTKERILSTLRNRMHTMERTAAFARLAEERAKKSIESF